jgi:hypothetical protein
LTKALSKFSSGDAYTKITDILKNSYDPFELAQIVLLLVGSIAAEDVSEIANNEALKKVGTFSYAPPGIPTTLINRLAIPDLEPASAYDAFQYKFVKVVTGLHSRPDSILPEDGWDGIFPSYDTLKDYASFMKSNYEQVKNWRPKTNGMGILATLGKSAWTLLNEYCDNASHEVFSDLWYFYDQDESEEKYAVKAQPVIVVRDKPFLLSLYEGSKSLASFGAESIKLPSTDVGSVSSDVLWRAWSRFDYVPRIKIPSSVIVGVSINQTINDTATLITADFIGADASARAAALSAGIKRNSYAAKRFGTNEFRRSSLFLPAATANVAATGKIIGDGYTAEKAADYYKTIADLWNFWYGEKYRMPDMVLHIRDDSFAIVVGFNIMFEIGNATFVGHVSDYATNTIVSGNGAVTQDTTITIQRAVRLGSNNQLRFFDMEEFGNIMQIEPDQNTNIMGVNIDFSKYKNFI